MRIDAAKDRVDSGTHPSNEPWWRRVREPEAGEFEDPGARRGRFAYCGRVATTERRRRAFAVSVIGVVVLLSAIAGSAPAGRPEPDPSGASEAGKESERPGLPAGSVFRDCDICPEMVVVPAGSFAMGASPEEGGFFRWETPKHRVVIARPFAVGKYEVTFAEWDACLADGGCGGHLPFDWYWGRGRRPVTNVNWEDAKAYVRWLAQRTGRPYRLLSEAEWEYAARAGATGPYHFGSSISPDQANFDGRSNPPPRQPDRSKFRGKTVPVGSFPPNAFGLHDMHGNVGEWVEDCWHFGYVGAPTDGSAWMGGIRDGDCDVRALRGGSWWHQAGRVRTAGRISLGLRNRGHITGFRVARDLEP